MNVLAPGEVEVWVDTQEPPYVLLLARSDSDPPRFQVFDSLDPSTASFEVTAYHDACQRLREDGFSRVEKR